MNPHSCPLSTCAQMCSLTCTCTCAHVCNCALVCGHSNVHVHAHTTVAGSNGYQVPGLRIGPIILFYSLQWVGHLQIDRTCSHSTSIQYNQEHVLKVGYTDSSCSFFCFVLLSYSWALLVASWLFSGSLSYSLTILSSSGSFLGSSGPFWGSSGALLGFSWTS